MTNSAQKIIEYAMENPSDWQYTFKLREPISYENIKGNNEIHFDTGKKDHILYGFTIKIQNAKGLDVDRIANEKARNLTNLISIIYGESVSSFAASYVVTTPLGQTSVQVMDIEKPLKPNQKLSLDLSDQKITQLLSDLDVLERMHHLVNALHNSYDDPSSAIKELVLAYGDVHNLPEQCKKYHHLRNALSHKKVKDHVRDKLPKGNFGYKFSGSKLSRISAFNRRMLLMENFFFLHHAIEGFRKEFGLETEKREG